MTRAAILLAAVTAAAGLGSAASAATAPDLIVYDGKIVTVDGKFSIARAAAVRDGRFVAVGSDRAILASAGPATVRIDLHGRTVLPGFNDSHQHQLGHVRALTISADLTHIRSIADIQAAIARKVATAKPGEWIQGTRGWWEYQLAEGRQPNRYDLDKVAPNNPVTIPGPHYGIVNSLALKLGGISKDSKDPQGGEIQRDPKTGEPTGLLFDNAQAPLRRLITRPTPEQVRDGLLQMIRLNNQNGITSVGEPSGDMADYALYRRIYDEGLLTTRVDFAFDINPALPTEDFERQVKALGAPGSKNFGDGLFRSDELGELNLDGAEQTSFLRHDFPSKPGYRGVANVPDQQQFNAAMAVAAKYGWRPRPHAVGDGAIEEALTAFEYANARTPIAGRRWMIDHAFLLMPDFYPRVKTLGVVINSQYMHNAELGQLILAAWGRPLADQSERYKDWLANGIFFAGGSDGPVSYFAEPIYEIYGMVTRNTLWGGRLGPDQGITREQAIRSVTLSGAYTTFEEKVKGSIEPGKYADFVVLSDDILKVPAERIKDIKVLATVLGGKTVYGKLE